MQASIFFKELKQAWQSWNLHYDEIVQEFGFIRNNEDACVDKKISLSESSEMVNLEGVNRFLQILILSLQY
jgi:hypothetical protein